MSNLQLPLRLGMVKPVVTRPLDVFSPPENDNEAQYVLILMLEQTTTMSGKMYFETIWTLYCCHRENGKNVLDAWIAAMEAATKKESK